MRFAISPKKPPSDNYSHMFFTVLLKCVPENGILPLLDSCLELWQNSQSARTMASMRPSTRTKKRPDKLAKVSSELWLWRPLFPKRDEGARHWLSSYHHLAWKKTKHQYPPVIVCRIWWWLVTAPTIVISSIIFYLPSVLPACRSPSNSRWLCLHPLWYLTPWMWQRRILPQNSGPGWGRP